jgi:glycosyltransferase involved in cell wall biosynthesis
VTDFGDNGSWVKDGETGYLFPCGDADSLADHLIHLLGDVGLRERLGANGRQEIVKRNSYRGEMKKMESIYADLVERQGITKS